MQIHKDFIAPEYKSAKEFNKNADDYFNKELYSFLEKNPDHNLKFSECSRHNHYMGYGTLYKGWEIRQPEVDRLEKKVRELEEELKGYKDYYEN